MPMISLRPSTLLAASGLMATVLLLLLAPARAHHPFEGIAAENLNLAQGFISGIGHPLLGADHLVFLLSLALIATLSRQTLSIPLLVSSLVGSLLAVQLSASFASVVPLLELIVALSVVVAGCVNAGWLTWTVLLPCIAVHGFQLAEPMVGVAPMPRLAYVLGLLLAQSLPFVLAATLLPRLREPLLRCRAAVSILLMAVGVALTTGVLRA